MRFIGDRASGLQFRPVAELIQHFRVGQRLDVLHRVAGNDIAHREFDDLAALGARNIGDLHDLRRHVPWRRVGADGMLDAVGERVVEHESVAQPHEQHHADVADFPWRPILPDDDALRHLVELLDLPVDLGGADADTAGIERGVRPAVDDHAVVFGQLDKIAVAPHARETLEVRGVVLGAVGVVPETDRHRGERRRAYQLAFLLAHWLAVAIVDVYAEPQTTALQLATPYRARRAPERETRDDVRPARDRRQTKIGLDALVDVVEALRRERTARREHRVERAQRVVLARYQSRFLQRIDVLGGR